MGRQLSDDPDQTLVAEARAGSRAAFEQLVRRHAAMVHRQAQCILGSEADAADVAQDAFARVHAKLDAFRGESKFSAWLKRIATNLALMRLRARRSRPETSIEDLLPTFTSDGHHGRSVGVLPPASGLDDQLARQDLLRQAIAQLPDNYREIVLLRTVQELSTQEAADHLEISVGAVKLRLHRAHQVLRAQLAAEFEVAP